MTTVVFNPEKVAKSWNKMMGGEFSGPEDFDFEAVKEDAEKFVEAYTNFKKGTNFTISYNEAEMSVTVTYEPN